MKYHIKTYGCQFNYSDSERTAAVLEQIGFQPIEKEIEADLIVFNTCSIRQKAEDRVYGMMPRMEEVASLPKLLREIDPEIPLPPEVLSISFDKKNKPPYRDIEVYFLTYIL